MPDMYGRFIYNDIDNFKEKYNKKTEYKYLKGKVKDLFHISIFQHYHNPRYIDMPFIDLIFVPEREYDFIVIKEENSKPEIDIITDSMVCFRITQMYYQYKRVIDSFLFKDKDNNDVDIYEILEIEKKEETNNEARGL